MIQLLVAVVLLTDVAFCADEPRVSVTNSILGDDCFFSGDWNEFICRVHGGDKATYTGTFNINGGEFRHLAIRDMNISIHWDGIKNRTKPLIAARNVEVCAVTGGNLTLNGDCGTPIIVEGTYQLNPYTIRVPILKDEEGVYLRFYASIRWDEANTYQHYEIGRLLVGIRFPLD